MAKIRAIVKRPDGKYGHVTNISNTLKNFQRSVGGKIEVVPLVDGAVIICNEEGKLLGLQKNFNLGTPPFHDVIVGDVAVVGVDGEEFCDCPIDFQIWKRLIDRWN